MKKEIDNNEKMKLYRTATEQLETRIYNSKGTDRNHLIDETFNCLDLETLAPKFVKSKKDDRDEVIRLATSDDPLMRIHAREKIKANRDLEIWVVNDTVGYKFELEKLKKRFKKERKDV